MKLLAERLDLKSVYGRSHRITWLEYGVSSVVIMLVALLVVVVWGPDVARAQAAKGYKQFLNGSVIDVWAEEIPCSKNGPCVHEYDCEASSHMHETRHHDSKGNYTHSTYYDHTHYESCPYATHEYNYLVKYKAYKVGTITIGSHHFAAEPKVWPHREQRGIPGDVARGEPPRWVTSKQRLQAGDVEPVTVVDDYTNYILPAEGTLYKQYDGSVEKYLKEKLLPEHTQNLRGDVLFDAVPQARKVTFVGGLPTNGIDTWQERLMRFNAVLGPTLQGDLHIVAMPANTVSNPQDYLNALVAHWQSDFGKWGFPKNGIALVIGVGNDGTIEWSRARTGMPEGNGAMLSALMNDLKGQRFDPEVLMGKPQASIVRDGKGSLKLDDDGDPQLSYNTNDGLLGQIMFREYPFARACMGCGDADDHGTGYTDLKDSIPVSTGSKVLWSFIVLLIAGAFWAAALFLDPVGFFTGNASNMQTASPRYPY